MVSTLKFIGQVHSTLKKPEDCPRQEDEGAPVASLEIFPEYAVGVRDIQQGSTILLLTWLHLANRSTLACQPRNNPEAPLTGVFSTRSPDRPNPVGIHTVKVLSVAVNGWINVSGLEVIDQTPLIDIKPIWNPK